MPAGIEGVLGFSYGERHFEDILVFDLVLGACQISSKLFSWCLGFGLNLCIIRLSQDHFALLLQFSCVFSCGSGVEHGDVCSSDGSLNILSCPSGGIPVSYLRLLFALLPPICDSFE